MISLTFARSWHSPRALWSYRMDIEAGSGHQENNGTHNWKEGDGVFREQCWWWLLYHPARERCYCCCWYGAGETTKMTTMMVREKGRRRFLGVARFLVVPHRRRTAQYPVQGDNDAEKESHTRIWGAKAGINQGLVVQMKLITLIWTVTFTQPNPCVIRNERSCCCC